MAHLNPLISDLALILGVAGIITLLFKKLKQPVVLGYIVAGFLCSGNFLLEGVSNVDNVNIWAEIGIIFLLFSLGLEFSFNKLMEVGGPALMTAMVIIAGMMCTGFMAGTHAALDHDRQYFPRRHAVHVLDHDHHQGVRRPGPA